MKKHRRFIPVLVGTVLLQEGNGSTTCLSTSSTSISTDSASCSAIDMFGGLTNANSGATSSATITLKNIGTISTSALTLTPSACAQAANTATSPYSGSSTTFCSDVWITIENDTTSGSPSCVYGGTAGAACPAPSSTYDLSTLGASSAITLPGLAPGATATYKFTLELSPTASNADQGLTATVPLSWMLQ